MLIIWYNAFFFSIIRIMSKEKLIQHIYDNIVLSAPHVRENQTEQLRYISDFIDQFLLMYPAHHSEISDEAGHDYQYREIALFTIAEFACFYASAPPPSLKNFNISQSISRFLFARHASLVALRSKINPQSEMQYPIRCLDTQNFGLNDHQSLLQKLTYCHVTSLSLIFPKAPGKTVLTLYVNVIHKTNTSRKLNHTLGELSFLGLSCDKNNVFLVEEILKNVERLPELRLSISLPEWDTLSHTTATHPHIAPYHELQNKIRDNQKTWAIAQSKGSMPSILNFSDLVAVIKRKRRPQLFVGDHRQFALMAPDDPHALPYFDRYLATRQQPLPIDSQEDETSHFSFFLELMRNWAITNGMVPDCAAALFASEHSFTHANAKSLGQLFNSLDSQQSGSVGTQRWIQTVNTIWSTFGKAHFFAWKACVLDNLNHWLDSVEATDDLPVSLAQTTPINPAHAQISWLQLISFYSANPQMFETHPEFIHFVQTLFEPNQRNALFGIDNTDLDDFFALLRIAPARWGAFFQDPQLSVTAAFIPCAGWICLLEDEKIHLRTLNFLPHFLDLFQNITVTELWAFGIKTLSDSVNENDSDAQIKTALGAAHQTALAYQQFIQKRNPLIWQSLLYLEEAEWCAEYFAMLHRDQYKEVSERILEATQRSVELTEIQWMLNHGCTIAQTSKSQDPNFLAWVITVMHAQDGNRKIIFMRTLFQNQSALGFYLDLPSLQHLWNLWSKNKLMQIEEVGYLAQLTLDFQKLKTQQQFQTYFSDTKQRHRMLHALRQGSLPLGTTVTQHCYQWFRATLRHIAQWVDWGNIVLGQRSEIYHQAYQILAKLIHELQIAHSDSAKPTHAIMSQTMRQQYANLFAEQEKCYAGFFWSCNRSRINQAQNLFKQLKEVRAVRRQDYYSQLLHILVNQQIAIFTADQSYCLYAPNQKGHSRLHDICTELFLTVCRDCLCDPDLSEQEKSFIQPLLHQQIKQHVALLAQPIGKTPLGQELNHWQTKEGDLQELNTLLSSHQQHNVSPKLQYLYRSLMTMITLPEKNEVYRSTGLNMA